MVWTLRIIHIRICARSVVYERSIPGAIKGELILAGCLFWSTNQTLQTLWYAGLLIPLFYPIQRNSSKIISRAPPDLMVNEWVTSVHSHTSEYTLSSWCWLTNPKALPAAAAVRLLLESMLHAPHLVWEFVINPIIQRPRLKSRVTH